MKNDIDSIMKDTGLGYQQVQSAIAYTSAWHSDDNDEPKWDDIRPFIKVDIYECGSSER